MTSEKLQFRWIGATLVIFLVTYCCAEARTIHVPADQSTIQAGIDVAQIGDTVLLDPGEYTGQGNRDIVFAGKQIVVASTHGAAATVIDCEGSSSEPHRAFIFQDGEDSVSVIEGLTISFGYGPSDGPLSSSVGGAILCTNASSPIIRFCRFVSNQSGFGGTAIFLVGNSSPRISNCLFRDNSGIRGAVTANNSSPTIAECIFEMNRGERGGAIYLTSMSTPIISDCEFRHNRSVNGGAIMLGNSNPTIARCTFWNNQASVAGGTIWSGGTSTVAITNCTIHASHAPRGAAVFANGSTRLTMVNTSLTESWGGDGVVCDDAAIVNLSCSNIFGSSAGDWVGCIAPQQSANGNTSVDPMFCGSDFGDLWPIDGSPYDAGNNSCGTLIGALRVGSDSCSCCHDLTGNIDCDLPGIIDIADLTSLVDHLFINFEPLCCREGGNVDGDAEGLVDISDLTVLIDNLFINFAPVSSCR